MEQGESPYFSAFIQITKAISSSLDLKQVFHLIVKSTCEITDSKGCTLMLLDDAGGELELKSSYGLSEEYVGKGRVSADKSISDTLKGNPVIIEDATSDPRIQYPREARQEGIASIISVPIPTREKIIGVLRLYTPVPCHFAQEDIDFLSAITVQVGLAIENARLYAHLKSDYEKLTASPSRG